MNRDGFSYQVQIRLKRVIDLLIATIVLAIWLPFLLVIGIVIKLDSPGPVLFRHRRVGKDGHPFILYKFRTMVTGGDDSGYMTYLRELIESEKNGDGQGLAYQKMNGDPRVTRVGKFLRNYYIDELPQFINIFKGEMSLVGPRPHVQLEVDHYTPWQRQRLRVKPGATGLWQVSGKADSTFCELLALDVEYIENWSLSFDFKIMAMTVAIMLRGGEKFWTRMSNDIPTKGETILLKNNMQTSEKSTTKWGSKKTPSFFKRKSPDESDAPLNQLPYKE
jgi:lipopolysaccharide/colanic/teichoic acid biosynthesis glycosyltransferase